VTHHDRAQHRARVVVDEVDNLDARLVRQLPVGHVALPGLVGQIRLEADPTRPRPLLGLGRHEAPTHQDPVDGREGGRGEGVLAQVVADGARARVVAVLGEALAQCHDGVLDLERGLVGTDLGSRLQGNECRLTAVAVELDVTANPRLRATRRDRDVAHRPPLDQDRGDSVFGQIHGHLRRTKCPRNTETWCPRNSDTSDPSAHKIRLRELEGPRFLSD
jgi:hypothetical protein